MMGVWIGAIQNMYPELGAGVEEHSILLREPLQRVARSVFPIMGVVYDGDRAGYKATMHALELCIEADVPVLVASRPGNARSGGAGPLANGVDPDSLVAGGGAAHLLEAVDRLSHL